MKLVVLGSTGMAGHVVAQYLQEQGHTVYRTSRSEKRTATSAPIDVTDFSALGAWLDEVNPDLVVNCIGLLQKSSESRADLAILVNSYLPHWLEHKYADTRTRIIHLSTDCVFSGKRGAYREDDAPDGETMYDRSKALGELNNRKDLTFRMSIIGPDIDPRGTGLFNWFMAQHGEIQGWSKTIWNGITTIELAQGIDAAIAANLSGIYQLVPRDSIDKYSLLQLFAKTFGRSDLTIRRVDGLEMNKSLLCTRKDFAFTVKPYEVQVQEMKVWVDAHAPLYPHYAR